MKAMNLSIVITTFNTKSLLRKAIKTIFEAAELLPCQHEIIVVDNHSSDKTAEMIKEEFPAIQLIIMQASFLITETAIFTAKKFQPALLNQQSTKL
ncbi:TPA: glycosyltransferase [Candidatus Poribacteria bacterium]|nr:glycosyltransferase [Candidatus Poribacteria bacterium]